MKKMSVILAGIIGGMLGILVTGRTVSKNANEWKKMSDKNFSNMHILNQWMMAKQSGKKIEDYFEKHNYQDVVIYGMGNVGERLLDELNNTEIRVIACVDRNAKALFAEVPILLPEDNIPYADCMIVTSTFFYEEIVRNMEEKVQYPIISLEDVIYEL